MNATNKTTQSTFRDRFTSARHSPSADKRRFEAETKLKYSDYEQKGKAIFAVTLSTFVTSEKIARSEWMSKFWEHDFLYRITEHLPHALKRQIDYDYVIEKSPVGHWHYHGLLAMPKEAADRIYTEGRIKKQLNRDLNVLNKIGPYREFAVNSILIEPIRSGLSVGDWISYMTKTHDYIVSTH